ncbi:MAG: PQQ-binding-like beta-propeller repeat protein [Bacteroidota bacterium]|nr:PQQ-binding-like beta-propeller repeat protein [Bacteroidota bacterium]
MRPSSLRPSAMRLFLAIATALLALSPGYGQIPDSAKETGKQVFLANCQACHKDTINSLVPGQAILASMTPRAILAALDNGKMRQQGSLLTASQRKAVAEWLTNKEIRSLVFPQSAYAHFSIAGNKQPIPHYSGWGGNKEGTGFRSSAQAGITVANLGTLKLKWAFAFPDGTVTRSKPALVGDWLIVGGQYGDLFAINKYSGKIGWHFTASAAIRGAIAIVQTSNAITAYFADFSTNVYAVDVRTGKQLWNKRAGFEQQSATTGSVAVSGGKVFVPITSLEVASAVNGNFACCTSSGALVALDAANGKEIWRHRVITQPAIQSGKKKNGKPFYGPSGAPVWCSPTVDEKRGLVYIGTGENYSYPTTNTSDAIQAIDMRTGHLIWNFQATGEDAYNVACPYFLNCPDKPGPDLDFGMAPILVKGADGKDLLLAGQKAAVVYALSPINGHLLWKTRVGKGGALGGIHWGMATDGKRVYAANADNLLALDKSDSTQHAAPGLYALDLHSGKVIWRTAPPAGSSDQPYLAANSAAPAVIPGIVFAGALDGHMRAYASGDGRILWDFDTAKEFETSNGVKGKGGSIDGPAPVISDGMLFVNSGYRLFGQLAGNLLLAFSVEPPVKK